MSAIDYTIDARGAALYRGEGWWRDRTILDDFDATAARVPDKQAIVSHVADGETSTLTYAELAQRVDRFAGGLLELGVGPGDVVSVQIPNSWRFTAIFLACARIGAIINPIVQILRRREVGFILNRTGSKVSIVPTRFRRFDYAAMHLELKKSTPSLKHVVAIGSDAPEGSVSFRDHFENVEWEKTYDRATLDPMRAGADTPCQIQFTSGTTGEPKGVVHTYNTLHLSVIAGPEAVGITGDDVILMASPLAHNTGFMHGMCMPLLLGMTAVYQDTWDPQIALRLIADNGVTVTMGSTVFLLDMCNAMESSGADLSAFRLFICGGAPIPPVGATLARDRLGVILIACWGMTENGLCTATRPDDPPEKVTGTDGRPLPWVRVKIVDDIGNRLPTGTPGRLFVKSASEHVTYLDRPDLYEASMHDGWFDTGDLATVDSDGYIRITGRTKDLIIRGGENIPALDVEAGLITHPEVMEVAVVAAPHDRMGECTCAVVVPVNSAHPPTLTDLTDHLERIGMSRTYWPERLEVRDDLPRTASGKVQKFALREEIKNQPQP